MKSERIRVSKEFRDLIYNIRAKELLINRNDITCEEVTRKIIKYVDWEKIWQNEYAKK